LLKPLRDAAGDEANPEAVLGVQKRAAQRHDASLHQF
jgi:hypothetical protein